MRRRGGQKDKLWHQQIATKSMCVCMCVCATGMVGNAALGKVYAPDPDDWDNKTYTLETSAAK